jgi:hypothetical protein
LRKSVFAKIIFPADGEGSKGGRTGGCGAFYGENIWQK